MHLAELARWRQGAYSLFSSVLGYPSGERLKRVAAIATCLRESSREIPWFAFFPEWQRLIDALASLDGCASPDLEKEYVSVFMHSAERAPCPPYESWYGDPEGRAAGWVAALVEGEYAAAGLASSPALKELPDHLTVELEFMGFLCGQEASAWAVLDQREAVKALERQAGFLDRHLLRWLPEWAGQVASTDGGLYSTVAQTALAFITHDQDLIGTLLERFKCGSARRG